MAKEVIMPKFGFTQEESEILEWLKQEGDRVEKGDPIAVVSTDKLSMEIEAPETGVLSGVKFKVGDKVPVTTIIAYILQSDESLPIESEKPQIPPAAQPEKEGVKPERPHATPVAKRMAAQSGVDITQVIGSGLNGQVTQKDIEDFLRVKLTVPGKIYATPAARRKAKEGGVHLLIVQGSGPQGRIQVVDVERAAGSIPRVKTETPSRLPPEAQVIPLEGMRRAIALNMQRSAQNIPHMFLQADVDIQRAEALRQQFNRTQSTTGVKLTLTAIIAKATAQALTQHPYLNSYLEGENIVLLPAVNLGIAVGLDEGLIVPVIQDAHIKGMSNIAREIAELSARAHEGRLRPQDVSDGSFTISNLGMYGIDRFSAIINPPQTGILAVGKMKGQFVPNEEKQPVWRLTLTLTLSTDHRVVDGISASKFLNEIREYLENPEKISL